ncbi:hypothetical protein GIB67_011853 [Kingdonia uniflora]|uniref:AB hydrolase-1 domain-containing protein n=1 Tax=Kingdonia uniflora TaxID=39325 RepID=A0A7J7MJY1_9MAGN|nr:hypothetical protein GIB67_011853 [Kingdonia uniflora]
MTSGRRRLGRQALTVSSKSQNHNLHKSFSNQFYSSFLYAPLLEGSTNSSAYFSEEIPIFSLDDGDNSKDFKNLVANIDETGNVCIVLVHGFGGGVFSWRHVMGVLARQVGCEVQIRGIVLIGVSLSREDVLAFVRILLRASLGNKHLKAEILLKSLKDLPVLVIAGAEDALVSLKSYRVMASERVNSRLVAVLECGHLPHEECPKALLAAL